MNEVLTAAIAGASAVAGGVVVAVANVRINRAQTGEAETQRLRDALERFLSIVTRIDQQLRSEPAPGRAARWINEQMQRFSQLDHAIG